MNTNIQVQHITHIHAALAVVLAYRLRNAHPEHITRMLNDSGCPRSLFVLASVLQAATRPGAIKGEQHD
jgi:hypothetical protein